MTTFAVPYPATREFASFERSLRRRPLIKAAPKKRRWF